MAVRGGHKTHILRINLGEETIGREPLPHERVLRKYIAGPRLGLYYLMRDASPSGGRHRPRRTPDLRAWPLTGTPADNSSDWITVCFNPCVPYAAGIGPARMPDESGQ